MMLSVLSGQFKLEFHIGAAQIFMFLCLNKARDPKSTLKNLLKHVCSFILRTNIPRFTKTDYLFYLPKITERLFCLPYPTNSVSHLINHMGSSLIQILIQNTVFQYY